MDGCYIYFGNSTTGLVRKFKMQMDEFGKHGKIFLVNSSERKRSTIEKIISRLPCQNVGLYDYSSLDVLFNKYEKLDYVYIRRPRVIDRQFLELLKNLRQRFPKASIIMEMYDYPYDKSCFYKDFKHAIILLGYYAKDVHYRKSIKKYIDRIVTFSDDTYIYGVRTIKTTNGVNVDEIKPVNNNKNGDAINVVSVAHVQDHHGYDRFIKGLYNYYKKGGTRQIIYHCVGENHRSGHYIENYKKLVQKYHLEDRVIFYGKKTGEELEKIYDTADIGLSSLALYKLNIHSISTLKTGEYLAKGLPVVIGCTPSLLSDDIPEFVKVFPNDSSNLDINDIIMFYDSLIQKNTRSEIIKEIRDYAYKYVDIKPVMEPIVNYINKRIDL